MAEPANAKAPSSRRGDATQAPQLDASAISKRKLSFKDKHALETLPKEIEKIGQELVKLEKLIADPGLYGRDRALFEATGGKIADLKAKQMAAEDRWLELEVLRTELEG